MQEDISMIQETLRDLIDRGQTTVAELAEHGGYGRSSVYAWLAGDARIPVDAVAGWIRHHPAIEVRQFVLNAIAGPRAVLKPDRSRSDLDVNHDGRIDGDDAKHSAMIVMRRAVDQMDHLMKSLGDGRLSTVEVQRLWSLQHEIVQQAGLIVEIATEIQSDRRPARNGGAA
jgi:hypothetical protein